VKRLADLPVTPPRIEEATGPWLPKAGYGAKHPPRHLPERSIRHTASGLLRVQRRRRQPPDLLCVGEVEVAADGGAEPPFEDGGKARFRGRFHDASTYDIGHDPGHERRRKPRDEVERLQRKVHPSTPQPDAAVARTVQQVIAQQSADIGHHGRGARRVQPVAAEVHGNPVDGEAAGVSADAPAP